MNMQQGTNGKPAVEENPFDELQLAIHRQLLETVDLVRASTLDPEVLEKECSARLRSMVASAGARISEEDRARIVKSVMDEVFGLGPLQSLLDDPDIADILVNGADRVYVERFGRLERTGVAFRDEEHVMNVIRRVVRYAGRRLDESSPMVDARLPDGSRVNAVIAPLSLDGPLLSIRRFGRHELDIEALMGRGMLTREMADFLAECVRCRVNIVISGGSGAGKTTLMNALSAYIGDGERVVTIEDAAELRLRQDHVVRLETRPPNVEGAGEITTREVVRNALRMRPDRILVGECRGAEAFDMLQAMNTGHAGSMTTMHSNGPSDTLNRLESMLCMAGLEVPVPVLREYVASAIELIIHVERMSDGVRRVVAIAEVRKVDDGQPLVVDIFAHAYGPADGSDSFAVVGEIPQLLSRMRNMGSSLDDSAFKKRDLGSGAGGPAGE